MPFDKDVLIGEGSGVKGLGIVGALLKLEEDGYLEKFTKFAGSSAGSIIMVGLACKISAKEMEKIMVETDFNKFCDDSWGITKDAYRVMNKFGFYKGDYFRKWFNELLYKYTGVKDITFKQIHEKYGTDIVVTGTNVSKSLTEYYHHSTYPDMIAADAVRISMSIPLFFQAVFREDENGDEDVLVDGGVLNNYPIWVYNCDGSLCEHSVDAERNPKVLGLKLVSPNEKRDDQIYYKDKPINSLKSFVETIISGMQKEIDRSHVTDGYWKNTVTINTFHVKTTDFDLSDEDKNLLIKSGYDAMSRYIESCETAT